MTDFDYDAGFAAVARTVEQMRAAVQPALDFAEAVEQSAGVRLAREGKALVESTAYEVARRSPGRTRGQFRRAAALLRGMRKSALLLSGATHLIGLLVGAIERPVQVKPAQAPESPFRRRERTDHQSDPPPSDPRATARMLIAAPGAPALAAATAA